MGLALPKADVEGVPLGVVDEGVGDSAKAEAPKADGFDDEPNAAVDDWPLETPNGLDGFAGVVVAAVGAKEPNPKAGLGVSVTDPDRPAAERDPSIESVLFWVTETIAACPDFIIPAYAPPSGYWMSKEMITPS